MCLAQKKRNFIKDQNFEIRCRGKNAKMQLQYLFQSYGKTNHLYFAQKRISSIQNNTFKFGLGGQMHDSSAIYPSYQSTDILQIKMLDKLQR